MNVVKLQVTQKDYEADEFGNLECQPQSIKVTVIRLIRAATKLPLRDVKIIAEERFGVGDNRKITGRVELTLFCDDAALGRLSRLVFEYQDRSWSVVKFTSIEVNDNVIIAT